MELFIVATVVFSSIDATAHRAKQRNSLQLKSHVDLAIGRSAEPEGRGARKGIWQWCSVRYQVIRFDRPDIRSQT